MKAPTVLVTGAGGFVGGRLTQRLALGDAYDVLPLVHGVSGPGAMRLARLPVDIAQGSVCNLAEMETLVAKCDIVVHCAVGNEQSTVSGTRTLLKAAESNGVDSFIHLSSASIHGHDLTQTITETTPIQPDTEYGVWKAKAERIVAHYNASSQLSPTIFRPFIIYGPHSDFVEKPVNDLKNGAVLTDGGTGSVNQIYVDNLIDAILLAMETPAAQGETFQAVDDDLVSWRSFYESFAEQVTDQQPIRFMSKNSIERLRKVQYVRANVLPPFRAIEQVLRSEDVQQSVAQELKQAPWVMGLYSRLPEYAKITIQRMVYGDQAGYPAPNLAQSPVAQSPSYELPSDRFMAMHRTHGRLDNQKMKEVLGWEQQISHEKAMEMSIAWLEYEDIL